MKDNRVMVILLALIIVILLGQTLSYYTKAFTWDAETNLEGNDLHYSVNCNYQSKYSVAVFERSKAQSTHVLIFYDEDCASDTIQWRGVWFDVKSISHELENRGCKTRIVNSEELSEALDDAKYKESPLLVVAGVLPRSVYDGTSSSKILNWIDAGGRLYWDGKPLGKYIGDENGTASVSNYSELFFNIPNAISENNEKAYEWATSGIGKSLSLTLNCTMFGLSTDLPGALSLGRERNGIGTAVAFPKSNGSIVVVAHDSGYMSRYDMSQIIASGITPETKILGYSSGTVDGNSVSGVINLSTYTGHVTAYVYLGGHLSTNGKIFSF